MTAVELRHLTARPGGGSVLEESWIHNLGDDGIVTLDLSDVHLEGKDIRSVRLDVIRVSLLANLVAGLAEGADITVTFARGHASLRRQLARTPLLAVLARHERVECQDDAFLLPWRREWNPHDGGQLAEMLTVRDAARELQPSQDSLLTLLSPHLRSRSTVWGDVEGIVQPWVSGAFIAGGRNAEQNEEIAALNTVMGELSENIVDHAFSRGRTPQGALRRSGDEHYRRGPQEP